MRVRGPIMDECECYNPWEKATFELGGVNHPNKGGVSAKN